MTDGIVYDPTQPEGVVAQRPDGTTVRFVSPEEYYSALLQDRMNVTLVFLTLTVPERIPAERVLQVDNAIARTYWYTYQGVLTPPRIRHLMQAATREPAGAEWLAALDDLRAALMAAPSMDDAIALHGRHRVQLLVQGVDRQRTELQVAGGELLTDYLLLQRAIAEDVRRAERERQPGEPRALLLERFDQAAELQFEQVIGLVLSARRLAEQLPPNRRPSLEQFARSRRPLHKDGLLLLLERELDEERVGPLDAFGA